MATKLEWVYPVACAWEAQGQRQRWAIAVGEDGWFFIDGHTIRTLELQAAKDYCQSQEDATAPVELPQPGDVYEVPGRKETRRLVHWASGDCVCHTPTGDETKTRDIRDWQSWVQSSGAVRIDGETHNNSSSDQLVWLRGWAIRALNIDTNSVIGREGWPKDVAQCVAHAVDKRVRELEGEVARLREALREIQSDADAALSGVAFVVKLTSMRDRAREAIQKEEGVKS